MKKEIIHTAGKWNPKAWPMYFAAANIDTLERGQDTLTNILVAMNELFGDKKRLFETIEHFFKTKKVVLIDSGVYWLSTQHAKKNDLTMDQALGLAPDQLDGFDELFDTYVRVCQKHGSKAWGYIEIDQGGRENKMKTRAKLEKLGLRPIPVYHPLNDGWEYFDYLAERYDRICFGNVVMAHYEMRKRLLATAWERRRKYPHLWIHALGATPSEITNAYPMNSCDSSTWILSVRWGHHHARIANALETNAGSRLDDRFVYSLDHDATHERGQIKATRMCGYDATMTNRILKVIADEQKTKLGADIGLFDK